MYDNIGKLEMACERGLHDTDDVENFIAALAALHHKMSIFITSSCSDSMAPSEEFMKSYKVINDTYHLYYDRFGRGVLGCVIDRRFAEEVDINGILKALRTLSMYYR